eukprot:1438521-Amphidinium_carterae.1
MDLKSFQEKHPGCTAICDPQLAQIRSLPDCASSLSWLSFFAMPVVPPRLKIGHGWGSGGHAVGPSHGHSVGSPGNKLSIAASHASPARSTKDRNHRKFVTMSFFYFHVIQGITCTSSLLATASMTRHLSAM